MLDKLKNQALTTNKGNRFQSLVPKINPPDKTPYILKPNNPMNILQMEPEFMTQPPPTPNEVAINILPPGFYFRPNSFQKTQKFYELILVDSDSARIIRKRDPKDETVIAYSTFKIKKILSPAEWGQELHKFKKFSVEFDPIGYNYWDYMDAWFNVFWDQNKFWKHSWFISFETQENNYYFPQWFLRWWSFFCPIEEILPNPIQQGFNLFKQKFNLGEDPLPIDLHFFSKLKISWIFAWQFRFSHQNWSSPQLPILQRVPYVRWWVTFSHNRADVKAVQNWFKENPRFLCQTETSKFLNQRSRVQACLAATSNKAEFTNQLKNILKQFEDEGNQPTSSAASSSSSSSNGLQSNEDDCYGIDMTNLDDDE